jgi:hypothetical protein
MPILTERQKLSKACLSATLDAIENYLHQFDTKQLQTYCMETIAIDYEKGSDGWHRYKDWISKGAERIDLIESLVFAWWNPFRIMDNKP